MKPKLPKSISNPLAQAKKLSTAHSVDPSEANIHYAEAVTALLESPRSKQTAYAKEIGPITLTRMAQACADKNDQAALRALAEDAEGTPVSQLWENGRLTNVADAPGEAAKDAGETPECH